LFEVVGRGGMGTVYRAEQLELGRQVAFKQLPEDHNEELRDRFVREARITAQLDHPGIVPVHVLEVSPTGRSLGYAMKLVEGKTLRTLLTETAALYEKGLPIDIEHSLETRLEHFLKICDAIAFAHDRGILHRDLKPANFMVGKFNEVYVMDWGVARPIGAADARATASGNYSALAEPELTQVGDIIGSAAYSAPEQAAGRNDELGPRADQYALGLILFELVSLRKAIDATEPDVAWELSSRGAKAPLVHVSRRVRIPIELRAIVAKATAFTPALRYESVAALAEDVRRYLRGDAVTARPDNSLQKLLRLMSRHRRTTLLAFLGLLAIAAVSVTFTLYRKTASELAARQRGERMTALYVDVAVQGYKIDAQFQRMQQALEGLGTAAVWALTGPEPAEKDAPIFFDTDFADPKRRPPDFTDKTAYRWPVSVEHPVVGISPGTDRNALLPKIRRLSPLRHHMREMFVAAATDDKIVLPPEEQRAALLERRGPIDYAYVALPEGVHFMLPGMDALPPGYDVRTAGFYTISASRHGKRWGSPYVDSTTDEKGDDLVLPCTEGLWSPSGEFIGVAGVEITVTKMVETSMVLPGYQPIRTTLVNGEGKKVIDSGDAGKRFEADGKDEGLALYEFDIPEVAAAIREGSSGIRELRHKDRDKIVIFVRLDSIGWYYVVELDAQLVDGTP
ncbi:MAG: protein kinase, partial [Polyangiaceae bacterium]|nr:protein kinase [Polyangiaceae bacterium]